MPELPDVTVYIEHLERRTVGHVLERVRLASPFVLRTAEPPITAVFAREVRRVSRLGKRIVFSFVVPKKEESLHLVIHLMVAGRFRWKHAGAPVPGKLGLAAFDFAAATSKKAADAAAGTLILTGLQLDTWVVLLIMAGDLTSRPDRAERDLLAR
jgi:formamidopyrimidine-DNA glycosylase